MAAAIQPISGAPVIAIPAGTSPAGAVGDLGAFQNALAGAVNKVEGTRIEADTRIQKFLNGEGEELHSVVLATQQAELSLELFQQVRNKVVQAYQEVMRMQM